MTFTPKHPGCVYIGGEWQPTDVREDVINPADESVIGQAPVGSAAQVEAAIAAARHAFDHGDWPRLPVAQRQALLTRFLDAIDARKAEIVDMIVAEAGSTRMLAEFLQYGIPMKHARRTVEVASRPALTSLPVELTPNALGQTTLGTGARYTRSHPPEKLLGYESHADRSSASKAEYRIKQLTAAEKQRYATMLTQAT